MCHLCQAKNYAIFQQKYQNDGLLRHICDTAPLTCWRTACLKRQTVQDSMLISMYFLQLHLALSTNWRWSHLILPPSNWLWWQITEKKTNMSSHICPLFFAMALRVVKTLNCTFLPLQDNLSLILPALFYLTNANSEAFGTQDRDYEAKGGDSERDVKRIALNCQVCACVCVCAWQRAAAEALVPVILVHSSPQGAGRTPACLPSLWGAPYITV